MMIATNISGRPCPSNPDGTILARDENAQFHFLKRLPMKLVRSECRTGRDTRKTRRGAILSIPCSCFGSKKIDRVLLHRNTVLFLLWCRRSCSIKGQIPTANGYREEISRHKINYLQRSREKERKGGGGKGADTLSRITSAACPQNTWQRCDFFINYPRSSLYPILLFAFVKLLRVYLRIRLSVNRRFILCICREEKNRIY